MSADVHSHSLCSLYRRFYRKWRALPASGRGDAGATAVVESLGELPQLTEVEVWLERNYYKLGTGLGGFVKASWTLPHNSTPQAKRRWQSSGPPWMRCRCVRNASRLFDPRPGRGPARSVVGRLRGLDSFGCEASATARWWWPFSRALKRSAAEKAEESEHLNLSPRSIAVLLRCWSWVFAGLGPLRTGVRIRR